MAGDERDRDEFIYYLVETALRVTAEVTTTFVEGSSDDPEREVGALDIELIHRADPTARRTLSLAGKGATWSVSTRADGALAEVSNENTPQGPAAIRIATNLLRLAGSAMSAGLAASGKAVRTESTELEDAVKQLKAAKDLVTSQQAKLAELRESMVAAASDAEQAVANVADLTALSKVERIIARSLRSTEAEVSRLASIVGLLKSKGTSTVTRTIERIVPIKDLVSTHDATAVPRVAQTGSVLQDDFELLVHRVDPAPVIGTYTPAGAHIEWREPRQVEIVIAQKYKEFGPQIVKRLTVPVVDEFSIPRFFEFDEEARMRSEDVSVSMGELGQLQSIGLARITGLSAAAESLGAATPALAQTIGEIGQTVNARASSRRTTAQLAQAEINTEIELATSRLELAGINATAADFIDLRKLEHAAAMAKARQAIAAADA